MSSLEVQFFLLGALNIQISANTNLSSKSFLWLCYFLFKNIYNRRDLKIFAITYILIRIGRYYYVLYAMKSKFGLLNSLYFYYIKVI